MMIETMVTPFPCIRQIEIAELGYLGVSSGVQGRLGMSSSQNPFSATRKDLYAEAIRGFIIQGALSLGVAKNQWFHAGIAQYIEVGHHGTRPWAESEKNLTAHA